MTGKALPRKEQGFGFQELFKAEAAPFPANPGLFVAPKGGLYIRAGPIDMDVAGTQACGPLAGLGIIPEDIAGQAIFGVVGNCDAQYDALTSILQG